MTTEVTATDRGLSGQAPLSDEQLRLTHAYWRAANYLSVGQPTRSRSRR